MASSVSVSNELPGARDGPEPFDTRLIPLDRDDDPVALPHSPRGHERSTSPNWSERGAVGVETDLVDWENSSPTTHSFSTRLQANSPRRRSGFTPAELWSLLRTLEAWSTEPTRKTGAPTRVVLEQGSGVSLTGVLETVDTTVTEKTPEGMPRTAELSLTFREQ